MNEDGEDWRYAYDRDFFVALAAVSALVGLVVAVVVAYFF